jgi:hypothetical protein
MYLFLPYSSIIEKSNAFQEILDELKNLMRNISQMDKEYS